MKGSDPLTDIQVCPVLTVGEVAQRLRVPPSWIYERTRRRGSERIPHRKMGKYLRFLATEVDDWFRNLPGTYLE
jgi:excisionase family DNA binding protein